MLTPFQRLLYCTRVTQNLPSLLLAASGPTVRAFNAVDGTYISKWTHLKAPETLSRSHDRSPGLEDYQEAPPGKRRKLSEEPEVSDASSTEIVVENGSNRRRKPKRQAFTIPSVTHLCGTADGKYVVAVTGEDKCVRVLEMLENGSLKQISERTMPKRPAAIALSTNQQTILCADKFGDVYALPLLGLPYEESSALDALTNTAETKQLKSLTISANAKTVHTHKNLQALDYQQRQKQQRQQQSSKPKAPTSLNFEHSLLLGHISVLTDILALILPSPDNSARKRSYILTSDRDEHIRVSRGMPQAHIIETYCLSHHNFVSKLHAPAWMPHVLISGGGDDYLLVWDWVIGEVRQEVNLRALIEEVWSTHPSKPSIPTAEASTEGKDEVEPLRPIAVSGIYSLQAPSAPTQTHNQTSTLSDPSTNPSNEPSNKQTPETTGFLLLTLEALPAILLFSISPSGTLTHHKTLHTPSNVLDIAPIPSQTAFLYALDGTHTPFSRNQPAENAKESQFLGVYAWVGGRVGPADEDERVRGEEGEWAVPSGALAQTVQSVNAFAAQEREAGTEALDVAALGELFYGIEHLRKKSGEEGQDER